MTRRLVITYSTLATVLIGALMLLFFLGPRWLSTPAVPPQTEPTTPAESRKIRAQLLYVSDDGEHLIGVDREVPYGEGSVEQARRIVEAVVAPPPAPYVSAIPAGTKLRALFLTDKGEAYVDLTGDIQKNHPGGTTNELLTVYSIVDALTMNLPSITGVQLLIDGKETDTLAGHLDLRRPLEQDLSYANRQSNP